MYKADDGSIVYSPTDIVRFFESPYASWMDRLRAEGDTSVTCDPKDPMSEVFFARGNAHEATHLESLKTDGHDVFDCGDFGSIDATREALAAGHRIIYQAGLAHENFAGWADFLERCDDRTGAPRTIVWDTKLSRHTKPTYILQLCCYAEMLEAMTGTRPAEIGVILGNKEQHKFRTDDFFRYYRHVKKAFLELMASYPDGPAPEPVPNADHGRWKTAAKAWLEERDHLSLVAGITRGQIAKLEADGITTLSELAADLRGSAHVSVPKLQRQARLQRASKTLEQPLFEILPPPPDNPSLGLAALPPASPNDVFFDMEGYPDVDESLEYLFGAVVEGEADPIFKDWWAHDVAEERAAFEAFVDFVHDRWLQDPSMHVYHYAPYEPTALKRLMGKFGSREDKVDDLLRGGVLIDLYAIVRRGVAVGTPSYSLKDVERLYRLRRDEDVTTAGESIVMYDNWRKSGQPGNWRESPILKAIRDYNEVDCTSTRQLAHWLRERQQVAAIAYVPATTSTSKEDARPLSPTTEARKALAVEILESIHGQDADKYTDERSRILELLAYLLEFHRREDKPMWWQFYERQGMATDELWDDFGCLADLQLVGEDEPTKQSRLFRYSFDPDQDTKLHADNAVRLVPDEKLPLTVVHIDDEGEIVLKASKKALTSKGLVGLPERTSIVPYEFLSADPIAESIRRLTESYLATGALPSALLDFLNRSRPRVGDNLSGALRREDETAVEAAERLTGSLEESCLCIQGPPGTGKTHTAAACIAVLLAAGKSIGITANSHAVILNLMNAVCRDRKLRGIKAGGDADEAMCNEHPHLDFLDSNASAASDLDGQMVGGTAWFFAREDMANRLDYLFVDEAGQVPIANLAGMAASARNIVLLGDQMQLGQPIQGTHPGDSGESLLEYYLEDHATIPEDLGLLLDTSYRMHPEVCRFISEAVYEGRLTSHRSTAARVLALPESGLEIVDREAGVLFVPVEHVGNVQSSDEEIDLIERVVGDLERCGLKPERDLLIVAPYNMQVRKLSAALPGVRVGSVDKFQGQEAPVVIVSMCASAGETGGRGLKFVLDQNRLNVAVSRAQTLAVVVGDPRLVESACASVADMKRMNLYCWIQEIGRQAAD